MSEKITAQHLSRTAYVYVRQSTAQQVQHNKESQRRQYGLVEHARALGFKGVTVIDDDLGISGSGARERPGFAKLLAAVCESKAGAVFAIEASRLARNNRDWHHLIDLCAMTETLVVDHGGVYNPRQLNDRLLLGLKGQMSEFELGLLRQRSQEALRLMIQRGEVLWSPPVGYLRTRENRCEMTPITAWRQWSQQEDVKLRGLRLGVEKARFEAERAKRQYDAANRRIGWWPRSWRGVGMKRFRLRLNKKNN